LIDIVALAVCAVIGGAEDWTDVVEFGEAKHSWFAEFLELPGGIPSHDTFARVFSMIDVEAFADCFLSWVGSLADLVDGRVVAIDGKSLRRSHDGDHAEVLHMVSAFCTSSGLVLGQRATDAKSNEITAIPELLELLRLEGAIVTIDAMGCQKKITAKIREGNGDYVIALKDNQPALYAGVETVFDELGVLDGSATPEGFSFFETNERNRTRTETRSYYVTDRVGGLDLEEWTDVRSVAMVLRRVVRDGRTTNELRYFISSLEPDAEKIANAVRSHWGIENRLHWVLDVVFDEDRSRARRDNSAQNLAVLRHVAINLLRSDISSKKSIKGKRHRAGWDNGYLAELVFSG
jgi:predicted transposase YbfD/YdcC